MKTIIIDHDDSFTYNLQHWLSPICSEIKIINHLELQKNLHAHLIVLSPGPHSPQAYPHVLDFLNNLSQRTAVFGVCLGLQILVHMSGGQIKPYTPPLHGKKSKLQIENPTYNAFNNLNVARYHSLYCAQYDTQQFETIAKSQDDNKPMWLCHREKKWMGVQFHPESFLTENSDLHLKHLQNWLGS